MRHLFSASLGQNGGASLKPEPIELGRARNLLAKFETEIERPEAISLLSAALILLSELRDKRIVPFSEIASNIALAYEKKVHERVDLLLSREPAIHWEDCEHGEAIFAAFTQFGFVLSGGAEQARSRLRDHCIRKLVKAMSKDEREQLLRELQAMDNK